MHRGPWCWSVDLIKEDARMKDEEDAKHGPTKAIDGLSFHQRTIDGDHRLIVHELGEIRGNMTKCGATIIDRPSC